MQIAMHKLHIVICGLHGSAIFFHITDLINDTTSEKKVIEHKMCVLIFSTNLS